MRALLVLVLLSSACGGDDDPAPADASSPAIDAPPPADAPGGGADAALGGTLHVTWDVASDPAGCSGYTFDVVIAPDPTHNGVACGSVGLFQVPAGDYSLTGTVQPLGTSQTMTATVVEGQLTPVNFSF
jgi:hypothetical protein